MNEQNRKELIHILMESEKPSEYFTGLRDSGELEKLYPELAALIGVEQDPVHHPEGDVFTHTMMVLDHAAALRSQANHKLAFMLAALLHDTGKAQKTARNAKGRLSAIGHEIVSAEHADQFLKQFDLSTQERHLVINLISLHMRPNMLARDHSRVRATNNMYAVANDPEDLILLAEADSHGRGGEESFDNEFLRDRYRLYREKHQDLP